MIEHHKKWPTRGIEIRGNLDVFPTSSDEYYNLVNCDKEGLLGVLNGYRNCNIFKYGESEIE